MLFALIPIAVIFALVFYVLYRSARFLGKDEQLRIQQPTEMTVANGPGMRLLLPGTYRSAQVVKAETLGAVDFVKVKDTIGGSERIEVGPKLFFLDAYDKVLKRDTGISLSTTEYVLVEDRVTGEKRVEKGPRVWFPSATEEGTKCTGISLSSTDYVVITDQLTGEQRIERGPMTWFPGPMEIGKKAAGMSLSNTEYVVVENKLTGGKVVKKGPQVWIPNPHEEGEKGAAKSLNSTEYIIVDHKLTGKKSMVKGPCVWFPEPYDSASDVREAISLQDDEYVRLKDMANGERWVQRGKMLLFLAPTWTVDMVGCASRGRESHGVRKAWVLKSFEFVRLMNTSTGEVATKRGEDIVFPGPDEQCIDDGKLAAVDLKVNEYSKVLDQATGEVRVVAGPEQVFLGPHERILGTAKRRAVEVDEERSVLVRDQCTGQLRLVTDNQLFVPAATDHIEEERQLIRLAEHEAVMVKDKDGVYKYHYGNADPSSSEHSRNFFLYPYEEIVKLCWSRGRRRETRDLMIEKFDCRAQYMSFEFNCRTKDNVELILEGTFFWQVLDMPLMVRTTGNTTGDICAHARSQFIKHVAQVTLKDFMEDLNRISNKVYEEDREFYESRGVVVRSLEVTGYKCAEESTARVLQQIIQETTNRMNCLSQQESANEVSNYKIQGQIEQEKLNSKLLDIQHEHAQKEARVRGLAEADKVSAFIKGLAEKVPGLEDRISMWDTLRKTEALQIVSEGGANLYYTPQDVDLSIEGPKA